MRKLSSNETEEGMLKFSVTDPDLRPIEADIRIFSGSEETTPIDEITTGTNGQSVNIPLMAPPEELSMEPSVLIPYSNYSALITAPGYEPVNINGINIFSQNLSIQNVVLRQSPEIINIGPNVLYGDYPPKIPEAEIKPLTPSDEIVLDRVVVPETIVVHDGSPSDSTAKNYTVAFTDYIKNVASSEIYPTWPRETLIANITAIISFTLNRVYTEWYRNKGYYFTITSQTAFDHKWIFGRNIFESISEITDEIFANYISRPEVKQPLLSQYCDGKRTTCSGMSQWGSKDLGDAGLSALQILRNYYGSDVYINTAETIDGVLISYPGYNLEIGSAGIPVRTIQEQLNLIRKTYSNIPQVLVDGIYGKATKEAVAAFQKTFNLPESGIVDYATWYKISQLYVALAKLAT